MRRHADSRLEKKLYKKTVQQLIGDSLILIYTDSRDLRYV